MTQVDPTDLRDVTGLWLAARVDSGSSKEAASRCVTDGRLTTALRRPGVQAFVARLELKLACLDGKGRPVRLPEQVRTALTTLSTYRQDG